ncbi:hypothetical protein CEXT_376501 [Caerostris extrusa]|uniref:Uncharacterized protein n=1 Tax=Caerostris extrusa TaxID=172846 RepID=A0AAV4MG91_CAEEX|nr:hypothetical protein CEXT_376501 [Caerostris extrusa]
MSVCGPRKRTQCPTDLTDCQFTAHDCRENKFISHRGHAVHWPLQRLTNRGFVQIIIKLKEVKGYLSQLNTVDPHHGWPLSIGVLGYRQQKFLKEYCGFNSVVDLYRECPHFSMLMDMEAPWANVPISPRFHKGFHREKNAKCSRYMVWYFGRFIHDQQRKLAWKVEQEPLAMLWEPL